MRLRSKTILGVGLIEVVLLAIRVGSALSALRHSSEGELMRRLQLGSQLIAVAAKHAVISQNLASLGRLVDEAMASSQISFVRILDATGVMLAQRGPSRTLPLRRPARKPCCSRPSEAFRCQRGACRRTCCCLQRLGWPQGRGSDGVFTYHLGR